MRYGFAGAALALVLSMGYALGPAAHAKSSIEQRLDRLQANVQAAEDIRDIKKLQRAYSFYLNKGMWDDLSKLFTQDAYVNYPAGIYIGYDSIRKHLYENVGGVKMGQLGLGYGRLYDHLSIQPVVHLDPGGKTARGRWRAFVMFGSYGGGAVWAEGVYEIRYAKVHGVWKIQHLVYYAGFGAPYKTGWAAPKHPRPRRKFKLAHPPDKPRHMACNGFPDACIAPFDYTNPGTTRSGGLAWTIPATFHDTERAGDARQRLAQLAHRVTLLQDEQQIENLQRIYGYYRDRAMWDQVAGLFADDGTIEMGQRGVYVGRKHIRQFLNLLGPRGLRYGWLNDHPQLQIIVDVSPDGKTARSRSVELGMTGHYHVQGTWSEGVYENAYVKQDGVWKFQSMHYYPTFIANYELGWGKDAQPAPGRSLTLPPDRPPTQVYRIYPQPDVPPFHYRNPVTGDPPHYPSVARGGPGPKLAAASLQKLDVPVHLPPVTDVQATLARAEQGIERVKDYDEVENLESAYGYYLDKDLWNQLSDLFAKDGSMELAQRGVYKSRKHIRHFLFTVFGKPGPVKNRLGNHIQMQPVINISPDGRTAKIRIRLFQQMAFGQHASIGGAIYENVAVKEDGLWKLKVDHAYNTLEAGYQGGWAHAAGSYMPGESKKDPPDAPPTTKVEMFPIIYDIPFHYANPVTGSTEVPPIQGRPPAPREAQSHGGPPHRHGAAATH